MIANLNFKRFHDRILVTNDIGAYQFLSEEEFLLLVRDQIDPSSELARKLKNDLFWTDESKEAFIREHIVAIREAQNHLLMGTSLFILAITNECNHRCTYCQANGLNSPHQMKEDVAREALKRISECPTRNITIEFQGGEPLMNFNIIRSVVEMSKDILQNKNVSFALVSNLSLLTDEIAEFLKEHNVSVSTSLDGPQELHDTNRPMISGKSGYQSLLEGLSILAKHGIPAGAIQTTTKSSLSLAEEIVDEYVRLGFRQIFIRPLTRLGAAARNWEVVGYSADDYLSFYRQALHRIIQKNKEGIDLSETHAALFLTKMISKRSQNYMELRSPCGAAIGQIAITASGNAYTCDEGRMLAEAGDNAFMLGNVFSSSYEDWINSPCCKAVTSASLLEIMPGCSDCVYRPYCGVCPVVNYAISGNLCSNYSERCRILAGIQDALMEYLLEADSGTIEVLNRWGEIS